MTYQEQLAKLLPPDSLDFLRIQSFAEAARNRYGEGHLRFACLAAFPAFLTPDLLYKLWVNFRRYTGADGHLQEIDRMAVSDLLLSSMVKEIAVEVFEMPQGVRNGLLLLLENYFPGEAGEALLRRLAEFTLSYVRGYQLEGESVTRAVREAQEWNALAYLNPVAAARELQQALAGSLTQQATTRHLRIGLLLEQIDTQYTSLGKENLRTQNFRTLVQYSQGMRAFFRGDTGAALRSFDLLQQETTITRPATPSTGGKKVSLPVPRAVYERLSVQTDTQTEDQNRPGRIFVLLTGIDHYLNLPGLYGCVNDVRAWGDFLQETYAESELFISLLADREATREAYIRRLADILAGMKAEDRLVLVFSGHGLNRADGTQRNALIFFDYDESSPADGLLYEDEFRTITENRYPPAYLHPRERQIILILDTHAGSGEWLDLSNGKNVILSACANHERTYEEENQGVFTRACMDILSRGPGAVTYEGLIEQARFDISGRHPQTPQVFGRPEATATVFLEKPDPGSGIRLQELLIEARYLEGPPVSDPGPMLTEAVERFRADWQVDAEADLLQQLKFRILAGTGEQLRLLWISQESYLSELPEGIQDLFRDRGFEVETGHLSLARQQARRMQKFAPPEDPWQTQVDEAQGIVILLDRQMLSGDLLPRILERINGRRQTGALPVLPLLVEEADWKRPELNALEVIYRPFSPDTAIGEILEAVDRELVRRLQLLFPYLKKREPIILNQSQEPLPEEGAGPVQERPPQDVLPDLPHLLDQLDRIEQAGAFEKAILYRDKRPLLCFIPSPPGSAPGSMLRRLERLYLEKQVDEYVGQLVVLQVADGMEKLLYQAREAVLTFTKRAPGYAQYGFQAFYLRGDTGRLDSENLRDILMKESLQWPLPSLRQMVFCIAFDVEAPAPAGTSNTGSREPKNRVTELIRQLSYPYKNVNLLPALGRIDWSSVEDWLRSVYAPAFGLDQEQTKWLSNDIRKALGGRNPEGYDLEEVQNILSRILSQREAFSQRVEFEENAPAQEADSSFADQAGRIRRFIEADNIPRALDELLRLVETKRAYRSRVRMIVDQWNQLGRDQSAGAISLSGSITEKNRIVSGILDLLGDLEREEDQPSLA